MFEMMFGGAARWKEITVFTLLIAFFSGLYGFIPGFQVPSLAIWYGTWGTAHSLANQAFPFVFHNDDTLIPFGMSQLGGFVVHWLIAGMMKYAFMPEDIAGNVTGIVFLYVTMYAFVRLMTMLGIRRWIGYLCASLFLASPFIYMHMDYGSMGFGFMLVPLSVLADMMVVRRMADEPPTTVRSLLALLLPILFIRLVLAGVDWYASVICAVGGGIVLLSYAVKFLMDRKAIALTATMVACWLGTWALGVAPWYLAMPHGGISEPFTMDLFRAQGVDLISLVVAKGIYLWAELLGPQLPWNGFEYFGDGTNVAYNYLGVSLLIAVVGTVIILILGRGMKRSIVPLLVAGAVCFILSLGPSLKIDSHRTATKEQLSEPTYEDYHMPASSAVTSLPTAPLYEIFPLSLMRAVYRWLLFTRFVLLIALGWMIQWLLEHKHLKFAFALALLAMCEMMPNYSERFKTLVSYHDQYHQTMTDVVGPLRDHLKQGERVFFLSDGMENDYLAPWLAPNLGIKLFNGGGDKSNWLALPHMPEVIRRLRRPDVRTPEAMKELILLALRSQVVDKIVVPYFSLRWDSYTWPPDSIRETKTREAFAFVDDLQPDGIAISREKYFSVLESKLTIAKYQHNVPEQLDVLSNYFSNLPDSALFLVDGAKAPLTTLFSGRSSSFVDYRESEIVNAAFKRKVPVLFVLTGYQKQFDHENYIAFEKKLEKLLVFKTTDYSVYQLSELSYWRLTLAQQQMTEADCLRLKDYLATEQNVSEIEGWASVVDFTKGAFPDQLCRGWFDLEQGGGGSYRWMGPSSTLFLVTPKKKPSTLVISVYPVVDKLPGKTQTLSVRFNGIELSKHVLRKQFSAELRIPLAGKTLTNQPLVAITLSVDKSFPITQSDLRELGLIVTRVGLE